MLLPRISRYQRIWMIIWGLLILICLFSLLIPLNNLNSSQKITVYDINNQPFAVLPKEQADYLQLAEMPPVLVDAFLAVEDHRFFNHFGINPGRIVKAAIYNILHNSVHQGASTITQQLAKNIFLTSKRSWLRKFKELFIALKLEIHYSKNEILEMYLNRIYFGHGAYGIKAASRVYFNREVSDLNPAEAVFLAVLPKGPSLYSPFINKTAAFERHRLVLNRLKTCGFISDSKLTEYLNFPLRFEKTAISLQAAPYFLDFLQDELAEIRKNCPELKKTSDISIESTLDLQIQHHAEKTFLNKLPKLTKDRLGLIQPQGAWVTLCPKSAEIRAMVGGSDYRKSQFNRATKAQRQPGSAFKPLLYAAALENGYTLTSSFDTTPQTYFSAGTAYTPTDQNNIEKKLSLRQALASSNNVIAVKILNQLKPQTLLKYASDMGINSKLPASLSLALGSGEVTLLELLESYLPLAAGGLSQKSYTIRRIKNSSGKILYERKQEPRQVIAPETAFLITSTLQDVFKKGGTAALSSGKIPFAAGKTGTSENNRDIWFVGYTPHLLSGLYIGCDNYEKSLPGGAGVLAAPIWVEFMSIVDIAESKDFSIPSGIVNCKICKESLQKATVFCPIQSEYFLAGTQPKSFCQNHRAVYYRICQKSGDLASTSCQSTVEKAFGKYDTIPKTCISCQANNSLWELLRKFFP